MMDLQLQGRKKGSDIQGKLWCGFTSKISRVKLFTQGNSFQAGFVLQTLVWSRISGETHFLTLSHFILKALNGIFLPMLLFSFKAFPPKITTQAWKKLQFHVLLSAGSVHLEKKWIHVQFQHFFLPGPLGVGVSTEGAEQLSTSTETGNVVGTEERIKIIIMSFFKVQE